MEDKEFWLEIHDPEITSAELVAEIERRVKITRDNLGEIHLSLPSFGETASFPDPPTNRPYNPTLYHHLRRVNELGPAPTDPILAASPATRLPVLGRLWGLVRRQFHELILFYVNRLGSHETKVDGHTISILNELTRQVEKQQDEIEELRRRLGDRDDNAA